MLDESKPPFGVLARCGRCEVSETHEELLPELAAIHHAMSVSIFDVDESVIRLRVWLIYLPPIDLNFSKRGPIVPLKILASDPE